MQATLQLRAYVESGARADCGRAGISARRTAVLVVPTTHMSTLAVTLGTLPSSPLLLSPLMLLPPLLPIPFRCRLARPPVPPPAHPDNTEEVTEPIEGANNDNPPNKQR